MSGGWRNRILEVREVTAEELMLNPDNWRVHPAGQKRALTGLLAEIGIVAPLLAYYSAKAGGALTLLDGHLRLSTGGSWPCVILDITDEEAAILLATFDPLTGLADANMEVLHANLQSLDVASIGEAGLADLLQQMLAQSARAVASLQRQEDRAAAAAAQVDRAEEMLAKWQVQEGQIWALGKHLLACGDCLDQELVASLLGGLEVACTVTSPPYPDAEMWSSPPSQTGGLAGEKGGGQDLVALCNAAIGSVYNHTVEGGVLCWNTADVTRGNAGMAPNTARDTLRAYEVGWRKRGEIIWEKGMSYMPPPSFTRRPTLPHCTHEMVMVFFKGDWRPRDAKGILSDEAMGWNRETVWKMATGSARESGHKAPFPLELAKRCVTLWSLEGDLVYDPFVGSGTTILACEELGRVARAVELEPSYCALTLERYQESYSVEPQLVKANEFRFA